MTHTHSKLGLCQDWVTTSLTWEEFIGPQDISAQVFAFCLVLYWKVGGRALVWSVVTTRGTATLLLLAQATGRRLENTCWSYKLNCFDSHDLVFKVLIQHRGLMKHEDVNTIQAGNFERQDRSWSRDGSLAHLLKLYATLAGLDCQLFLQMQKLRPCMHACIAYCITLLAGELTLAY